MHHNIYIFRKYHAHIFMIEYIPQPDLCHITYNTVMILSNDTIIDNKYQKFL